MTYVPWLVPDRPPRRLGFEGDAAVPRDFFRRSLWPLRAPA